MASVDQLSPFGKLFVSYGSYHHNNINKWIHIVFVPIIAATLLSLLSFIPFAVSLGGIRLGVAEVSFAAVMCYYFYVDLVYGAVMLAVSGLWATAWRFAFAETDSKRLLIWVAILHIVSWVFQFIGHGVFEKRKPALFDSVPIIYAPFFVAVQLADMLGMGKPELKEWKKIVSRNVALYWQSKGIKAA